MSVVEVEVEDSIATVDEDTGHSKTTNVIVAVPTVAAADQLLLEWLSTSIARDGGASLVTSLKDHYWVSSSPKKLNHLLLQSSIGTAKLLRFLEFYSPAIFQVDRNTVPHWVVLTDPTRANPYIHDERSDHLLGEEDLNSQPVEKLHQKILYVLRRRQARLYRRGLLDRENHPESFKVNSIWLVKESPWELHFYLRAMDLYRTLFYANNAVNMSHPTLTSSTHDETIPLEKQSSSQVATVVHPVMSPEWQEMVVPSLETFLMEQCDNDFVVDRIQHRVWLRTSPTTVNGDDEVLKEEGTSTHGPLPEPNDRPPSSISDVDETWLVNHLLHSLIQLVKNDGATKVALGLLLHRHDSLRTTLGGRDLWHLYQEFPDRFTTSEGVLHVQQRPPRGDVYLEWKPCRDGSLSKKEEEIAHRSSAMHGSKAKLTRMKVDTVGLFSVTNSRWASAIANIMIQCCQGIGWNVNEMTAIDMTASVGGMTLGLAKAKQTFRQIVAMEIDETRARLCQENMNDYGIQNVTVLHTDSVAAISTFPDQCCIVIDPPWGGEHYKEFKDQPPLELGPWKLEDVILKISKHVSVAVVGLRLPVTLSVDAFLEEKLTKERGLRFDRLMVRKLNVQLLVVLKLQGFDN